jgi:hypothetical protein
VTRRVALALVGFWLLIASASFVGTYLANTVRAASRPAAHPTATVDLSRGASDARLPGAPHQDSRVLPISGRDRQADKLGGAPLLSGRNEEGIIRAGFDNQPTVRGLASHYGAAYGPGWLALPEGPGVRVRICGPAACIVRTSNDAGPDLAMQRAGRIADLSWADFRRVGGIAPDAPDPGLLHVAVERLP